MWSCECSVLCHKTWERSPLKEERGEEQALTAKYKTTHTSHFHWKPFILCCVKFQTNPGKLCSCCGTQFKFSLIQSLTDNGFMFPLALSHNNVLQWLFGKAPSTVYSIGRRQQNTTCSWKGNSNSVYGTDTDFFVHNAPLNHREPFCKRTEGWKQFEPKTITREWCNNLWKCPSSPIERS